MYQRVRRAIQQPFGERTRMAHQCVGRGQFDCGCRHGAAFPNIDVERTKSNARRDQQHCGQAIQTARIVRTRDGGRKNLPDYSVRHTAKRAPAGPALAAREKCIERTNLPF